MPVFAWGVEDLRFELIHGQPPAGFDCGRDAQNAFLYGRAWRDAKAAVSVTHLMFVKGIFAGFVTLLADGISLGREERPRGVSWRVAPAMKIGQLAVDRRFHGAGLGLYLVAYAIQYTLGARQGFGCRFIILDSEPNLTGWYAAQGFIQNREAQEYRKDLARTTGRNQDALPVSMRFDLRRRTGDR